MNKPAIPPKLQWSGPGRALQFHLQLFEKVDASMTWLQGEYARMKVTGERAHVLTNDTVPSTYYQRNMLMTSMADIGQMHVADGSTTASERNDWRKFIDKYTSDRTQMTFAREHKMLNAAETHYVSARISNAIQEAAESAEPEILFPTDLPCPAGLIVLEEPLIMEDFHPDTGELVPELWMPIRAIGWEATEVAVITNGETTVKPGISYWVYADEASFQAIHVKAMERLLPEHAEGMNTTLLDMWCCDFSGWAFGTNWKVGDGPTAVLDTNGVEVFSNVGIMRRFLWAYWRWTWQRITVLRQHRTTRPESRQAVRAGRRLDDVNVKVVMLRREWEASQRGTQPDSDPFRYDHQWLVRPHWRRQWFRSLGPARHPDGTFNEDSHRLVWIDGYTKGNPWGPLVVGHVVTSSVR